MGTSLCVLSPMISASCISQEDVRNEDEDVAKDLENDPTQVSSSMASSPCQEAMFHEESIRVATITTVEDSSIHSTPFSSMSSIMNGEDVFLVDVHREPSLEDGFSSHESIGSKYGEVWMSSEDLSLLHTIFSCIPPPSLVEFLQVRMKMENPLLSQWHIWDSCSTFL